MRRSTVPSFLGIFVLLPLLALPALAQGPPPPPPPLQPLPPPPQPAGNLTTTAKANLGKALFWDEQVSSSRTVACGSCHQAAAGGTDPRTVAGSMRATHPGADGISGTADDVLGSPGVILRESNASYDWSTVFGLREQVTGRRAPSHVNAAYSANALFWDGRATGTFTDPVSGAVVLPAGAALESQAAGPPVSSGEMGHVGRDWNDVASRVSGSKPLALAAVVPAALSAWIGGRDYPALFLEAFGSALVTPARIAMAIASYERTLFSTQAPFDSLIAGTTTLTPQEQQGFVLFGQLPCARCHAGSLTSDNQFHYIGVRPAAEDSGRMVVTHNAADLGAFKTPTLRNVALRPSFMHDGRFHTLAEVVDFYDRGGDFTAPNKDPLIVPLHLTPGQKAALVAFLSRPLTDPRVANSVAPFDRPSLYGDGDLVPQVLAGGVAGVTGIPQPVAIEPPLAGNPTWTVGITGAAPGAAAVLVIDAAEPATGGIPASGSFARVSTTIESGPNGGYGSVTLAIPDDPALYGKQLHGRWYVSDPAAAGGVAASPAFQFRVFGAGGQGVLAVGDPPAASAITGIELARGRPNPFVSATTIAYAIATPSRVRLSIFDLAGRAVRRLVDAPSLAPGRYSAVWDGRDDAGHALPGGVYFTRLEAAGGTRSGSIIRLE